MTKITIIEESPDVLPKYAKVSIAFDVTSKFVPEYIDNGLGGMILKLEPLQNPYRKDYDDDKGEGPERWLKRFDLTNWRVFSAFDGDKRIGGALVAWNTPGINMLQGRSDLAVLWDIRINNAYRGQGIGSALVSRCIEWAKSKGCRQFNIETQNNNANACRFYAKQGAILSAVNQFAYSDCPDEIQFIWSIYL